MSYLKNLKASNPLRMTSRDRRYLRILVGTYDFIQAGEVTCRAGRIMYVHPPDRRAKMKSTFDIIIKHVCSQGTVFDDFSFDVDYNSVEIKL
jgi:hypothetical protein